MKRLLFIICILAFLPLSNVWGQEVHLEKAMAKFDEAFIPVWVHTFEGNIWEAKGSVFNLAFEWQKFSNRFQNAFPEDALWAASFDRIDGWLGDAFLAIDDNCAAMAFNQLEHVKYDLQMLRKHKGIDYYLDHIFDLQNDVQTLIVTSSDELLCLLQWAEYDHLVCAINAKWESVELIPFDAEVYGFTAKKEQLLYSFRDEVGMQIDTFNATMDCANREELALASENIELALMQMIALFGDFGTEGGFMAVR
jgi:hypothetical protein